MIYFGGDNGHVFNSPDFNDYSIDIVAEFRGLKRTDGTWTDGTWTELGAKPRASHRSIYFNNKIFIVGGDDKLVKHFLLPCQCFCLNQKIVVKKQK